MTDRQGQFNGHRLLLVEDDVINRSIVLRLLVTAGWTVDTAKNGEEAVSLAGTYPYDLILMDIIMPVMDGHKATKLIHSESALNRDTPIVAMTGDSRYHDLQVCKDAGMKDYIAKPVVKEVMFEKIATWAMKKLD